MQRPLGVTAISSEADRKAQQNQQGIQQLRNKCGNRSTLYPHGGKPELAEYQQVVQPGVGSHRAKAACSLQRSHADKTVLSAIGR